LLVLIRQAAQVAVSLCCRSGDLAAVRVTANSAFLSVTWSCISVALLIGGTVITSSAFFSVDKSLPQFRGDSVSVS